MNDRWPIAPSMMDAINKPSLEPITALDGGQVTVPMILAMAPPLLAALSETTDDCRQVSIPMFETMLVPHFAPKFVFDGGAIPIPVQLPMTVPRFGAVLIFYGRQVVIPVQFTENVPLTRFDRTPGRDVHAWTVQKIGMKQRRNAFVVCHAVEQPVSK
jgi:hypothetical protein